MADAAGWVRLADASALAPGAVAEASFGDDDLVVWRDTSGRPCVMDARCPHQWSHLAYEGVVDGDELVCLTHMWRFTPDGAGWKDGMTGRRDRKGDIAVWPCEERDGAIWTRARTEDPA
jgi:phenylpropionate dioxygenase-like ring-hydroxylating dioxygenase large terminal subunit